GSYQVPDAALEVHAVAPQAVVHQHVGGIELLVEKDARVSGAVRARLPGGVLLPVTALARLGHGLHVRVRKTDSLRQIAAQMRIYPGGIVPVERNIKCERPAVALLARDAPV